MAHFAKIDDNNVVTQVITVSNDNAPDEKTGQEYIVSIGLEGTWLQTSYNTLGGEHLLGGTPFRKNYAGIGYTYDAARDAFIPFKPEDGNEYRLDENTCTWYQVVLN